MLSGNTYVNASFVLVDRPATGVHHGSISLEKVAPELRVAVVHYVRIRVTPVKLDIINLPRSKSFRILL